jgi:hypothetical protein
MRYGLRLICCLMAVAGCSAKPAAAAAAPAPIYGVTLDSVADLNQIVASLAHLPRRPTVRIAFDPGMQPADYRQAVGAIGRVAAIMAEPVDSSEVTGYTPAQYVARFKEYLAAFGPQIAIWEVGNEVNGNWLGPASTVRADIEGAYQAVSDAGGQTALTLTYEPGCGGGPSHDMWTWAARNIPAAMKQGLDYVLVSYYEEDCDNYRPAQQEWDAVFGRLHAMFPHARLGFGEVGTNQDDSEAYKLAYLSRYYRLRINVPGYIGGYFWWYYAEDMVPYQRNPLWQALAAAFRPHRLPC